MQKIFSLCQKSSFSRFANSFSSFDSVLPNNEAFAEHVYTQSIISIMNIHFIQSDGALSK